MFVFCHSHRTPLPTKHQRDTFRSISLLPQARPRVCPIWKRNRKVESHVTRRGKVIERAATTPVLQAWGVFGRLRPCRVLLCVRAVVNASLHFEVRVGHFRDVAGSLPNPTEQFLAALSAQFTLLRCNFSTTRIIQVSSPTANHTQLPLRKLKIRSISLRCSRIRALALPLEFIIPPAVKWPQCKMC